MTKPFYATLLLLVSGILNAGTVNLVATTDNPENSLHVFALQTFEQKLSVLTNGKINAQIHFRDSSTYPAMGGEEDNVNMVMAKGSYGHFAPIQMTVVAAGNASTRAHLLEFLMLPYMFPNLDSAKKLFRHTELMEKINNVIAKRHNIRVLGWLIGGYRHMTNSKVPVSKLSQMDGLVIRTPRNRLMLDTYSAFGAKAIPVSWSDTFKSLKNGKVDGQENPLNVIAYSKFWEAGQRYVTKNGPFLWIGPMLIKDSFYQTLSAEDQMKVKQAAQEAAEAEWAWVEAQTKQFQTELEANGMKLIELEDKEQWMTATRPLWDSYAKIIGYGDEAKGKSFINEILAIINSQ